jgi:hypothetical protein
MKSIWPPKKPHPPFDLSSCIEMQLQINSTPAVLAQGDDILNRAFLLLPACICERFCDGPFGKIERPGTKIFEGCGAFIAPPTDS